MNDREENQIIKRICQGHRHEYALLVDRYKTPLLNLAYRMTGNYDDAEDLAQETFVRAYEKLSHFDRNRSFFTWLYTIGLNLIRNHLKKAGRTVAADPLIPAHGEQQGDAEFKDPERSVMNGQDMDRLHMALLQLSEDLREVLILRFQQGLSFSDIAEVAGISQSAAKMRVYRGLERLRELMEDKG